MHASSSLFYLADTNSSARTQLWRLSTYPFPGVFSVINTIIVLSVLYYNDYLNIIVTIQGIYGPIGFNVWRRGSVSLMVPYLPLPLSPRPSPAVSALPSSWANLNRRGVPSGDRPIDGVLLPLSCLCGSPRPLCAQDHGYLPLCCICTVELMSVSLSPGSLSCLLPWKLPARNVYLKTLALSPGLFRTTVWSLPENELSTPKHIPSALLNLGIPLGLSSPPPVR